jgi:hypothetical protein
MTPTEGDDPSIDAQLQVLDQHYTVCEPAQVQQVLRHDHSLLTLLLDVYPKIVAQFPDARIFLHAVFDPEPYGSREALQDNNREIAAFISTSLSPQEAMQRLTDFYQTCWGQAIQATHGRISVGLECL